MIIFFNNHIYTLVEIVQRHLILLFLLLSLMRKYGAIQHEAKVKLNAFKDKFPWRDWDAHELTINRQMLAHVLLSNYLLSKVCEFIQLSETFCIYLQGIGYI